MATYQKETALFKEGAIGEIKDQIDETQDYFWVGEDGKVHVTKIPREEFLENPEEENILIDDNGLRIRRGEDIKAQYGETVIIGKPYVSGATDNESRMEIDYHSLKMTDFFNDEYFHISNLVDKDGNICEEFNAPEGGGTNLEFQVQFGVFDVSSVKVDGVELTQDVDYTRTNRTFTFLISISSNALISIKYITSPLNMAAAKAYTIGLRNGAVGVSSFAEGFSITASGPYSHAEGRLTTASGESSHAEGYLTNASGDKSHAEGRETTASGIGSHAEGYEATASGSSSHAEGYGSTASGRASHAEGYNTTASGWYSHAEGMYTTASDFSAHAEGDETTAIGQSSHAEGYNTTASEDVSHAEGHSTIASGNMAHAQNESTIAAKKSQTSLGTYNVKDTARTTTHPGADPLYGQHAVIIGNGTDDNACSNAAAIQWDGTARLASDVYIGCNSDSTGGRNLGHIGYSAKLYGKNNTGDSTITLSASNKNVLSGQCYGALATPTSNQTAITTAISNDVFEVDPPNGLIAILEEGMYLFTWNIYFYNGFTVGDNVYSRIVVNENNYGQMWRRVKLSGNYQHLQGTLPQYYGANNIFKLNASNSSVDSGTRGTVSRDNSTHLTITRIG